MSSITRRSLVSGTVATGAAGLLVSRPAMARQATPAAESTANPPEYATVRVRTQPSAALNQAIFPDVMASLLPPSAALPGFLGYTFVFDEADPATAFTFSTLTTSDAALASVAVAQEYVDQLDPRFVTETPLSAEGGVRMYATTDAPATELPPFLHGAVFTMRNQTNAPGFDLDAAVATAQETLVPLFQSLPGFVLYCWFERPGGRVAVNIWETESDLVEASEALGVWRGESFATPTSSEEEAFTGTIGYATIAGLT